jgi:hypothetical protein
VTQTAITWAKCPACEFNLPLSTDGRFPDHQQLGVTCLGACKHPADVSAAMRPPVREVACCSDEELPASTRHECVKALWSISEGVGVKTILQHLMDEMPAAKLSKLLVWVRSQQKRAKAEARANSAEDDAVGVVVALGERRENVLRWLETAKAGGATNCDGLVRRMLQERNKR